MPLAKTPITINFSGGLDTKTDPNQVSIGKFLNLVNSVRTTTGRLTKRNGYPLITTLPSTAQTTLTTLGGNLLATGSNLYAFSQDTNTWVSKGVTQPVSLSVKPVIRTSTSQTTPDAAVASNGLSCVVFLDNSIANYVILDTATGEQVVAETTLPSTAAQPHVFILGTYFIITYLVTSIGTHLQYIKVPIASPSTPSAPIDLATDVKNSLSSPYDCILTSNTMFFAYQSSDAGTPIKINFMTSTFIVGGTPVTSSNMTSGSISLALDGLQNIMWLTFWDSGTSSLYSRSYSTLHITPVTGIQTLDTSVTVNNITTLASNQLLSVYYEILSDYESPYPVDDVKTDFIKTNTLTQAGTPGTASVVIRSVGLASKAFVATDGLTYMLVAYGDTSAPTLSSQPSYFLMRSDASICMRLASSNGGGFTPTNGIGSVSQVGNLFYVPYRIADFLATVNKGTNLPSGTPTTAIYTQTGINIAMFGINTTNQYESEIAGALHLTGGQLWEYDGVKPVEHGFHVWPENVQVTTSASGGSIGADTYFYVFTYEWTDNAGNLHRSAPSIPFSITTTGSTSTNTCYVPTLRLSYKTAPNPVRIVGYRLSVGQPVYYQFTSITSPVLNDQTVDYVTITDTLSNANILGQTILYTTGGVIENLAAPASIASAMFKNRLFLIDAEDPNLLWYSKQVISNTPVEMSDLLTLYIAPTSGTQGSTGPMTAVSALDDKLIIFKNQAIYYLTGNGPDITGSNNDFSDPIFITSSVGCTNPNSIVLMPSGLMFQSDKGIWLLGRDLSTTYIGAEVEVYNNTQVRSAQTIPGTTQVRFILQSGTILMYDYYYQQWGTFTTVSAISSTLYQGLHTYLNNFGQVFQESPGTYLDGSSPVLMSFTTSWINAAGLRGFERFYDMYMLGTWYSPFKLNVLISYDFNPSPLQSIIVTPDNLTYNWGSEQFWGNGQAWGGPGNVFQARIAPKKQKCQTFQVTVNEVYDSSFGIVAGQGVSLSGFNIVIGAKLGYPKTKGARTFG